MVTQASTPPDFRQNFNFFVNKPLSRTFHRTIVRPGTSAFQTPTRKPFSAFWLRQLIRSRWRNICGGEKEIYSVKRTIMLKGGTIASTCVCVFRGQFQRPARCARAAPTLPSSQTGSCRSISPRFTEGGQLAVACRCYHGHVACWWSKTDSYLMPKRTPTNSKVKSTYEKVACTSGCTVASEDGISWRS